LKSSEFLKTQAQNGITVCSPVTNSVEQASISKQFAEFFTGLLDTGDWPPRWYCGNWSDFHGWLYILSDVGIWAAYFAIPLMLLKITSKIIGTPFYKIILLFVAFIMLCGLTHLIDAAIFWWPVYRLSALLRFVTAIISILTVYSLYKKLPLILSLRTLRELETEVAKRHRIEEKLSSSEFLLSEAVRISRVGGWETDLSTTRSSWSKTVLDIIELPSDHSDDNINILDYFQEDEKVRLADAFMSSISDGAKWDMELMMTTYHSKVIWVRTSGEPVYDRNGKVVKIRGILMDIDKYKLTELALNKSLEITTKNNGQLKNFTHILSHNIRNHASNLQLLSSLIVTENLDEENAELFGMIQNVSTGLDATLDDLSQALKIKESIVDSEILNFATTAEKVLNVLESDIHVNQGRIEYFFEEEHIMFPRIYLESILINLISNAIKYRKPNVSPVIRLSTYKDQNANTVLECTDNGLGIDLSLHGHKMFGLYKTFHDHKDAHGVGLFLVKTQIESQGGHIKVESALGEGSTFKIIFND